MTVDEQAVLGAGMGQVVSGYAPAKLADCLVPQVVERRVEEVNAAFRICPCDAAGARRSHSQRALTRAGDVAWAEARP